ncbi:hypothetical protein [Actinoplanes sp. NPDC026670]|uniref:hypothetical protein n=1 Tax=Actinoplanes sp. NPDC026670 TaxID=3154700 RepID=UPI0033D95DB0
MVIADGPVNSAGAARTLNGKVTGSKERGDIAIQKAPPVNPKADTRRTGSKKFGPMQVGAGSLSARAVWAHGMACGKAVGDTSSASAGISRVTIAGGGSASLVRIPEKITSRSGTALRLRGGVQQSVGSATITAGRISLADNEVRLRLLRAPELRVSMTATGQSRVEYQPPVVEVTGKDGKKTRLSTAGDHIEITLSDDTRTLESLPTRLDPIGDPPLPKVSGLPALGRTETTPTPDGKSGSTLRITLGDVRQASKNNAVAARVTAIRVTLTRNVDRGPGPVAAGPSSVVADLGFGSLSAAAVAPTGKIIGRYSSQNTTAKANASSQRSGTTSGRGINSGWGDASGRGVKSGTGTTPGQGTPPGTGTTSGQNAASGTGTTSRQNAASGTGTAPGQNAASGDGSVSGRDGVSGISGHDDTLGQGSSGSGTGLRTAALPVTGPRVVSLLIAGVAMIAAGAAAVYLTSRRRKRT